MKRLEAWWYSMFDGLHPIVKAALIVSMVGGWIGFSLISWAVGRARGLSPDFLILAILFPSLTALGLWFRHEAKEYRQRKTIERLKMESAERFREALMKAAHDGTLRRMTKPTETKGGESSEMSQKPKTSWIGRHFDTPENARKTIMKVSWTCIGIGAFLLCLLIVYELKFHPRA